MELTVTIIALILSSTLLVCLVQTRFFRVGTTADSMFVQHLRIMVVLFLASSLTLS